MLDIYYVIAGNPGKKPASKLKEALLFKNRCLVREFSVLFLIVQLPISGQPPSTINTLANAGFDSKKLKE